MDGLVQNWQDEPEPAQLWSSCQSVHVVQIKYLTDILEESIPWRFSWSWCFLLFLMSLPEVIRAWFSESTSRLTCWLKVFLFYFFFILLCFLPFMFVCFFIFLPRLRRNHDLLVEYTLKSSDQRQINWEKLENPQQQRLFIQKILCKNYFPYLSGRVSEHHSQVLPHEWGIIHTVKSRLIQVTFQPAAVVKRYIYVH